MNGFIKWILAIIVFKVCLIMNFLKKSKILTELRPLVQKLHTIFVLKAAKIWDCQSKKVEFQARGKYFSEQKNRHLYSAARSTKQMSNCLKNVDSQTCFYICFPLPRSTVAEGLYCTNSLTNSFSFSHFAVVAQNHENEKNTFFSTKNFSKIQKNNIFHGKEWTVSQILTVFPIFRKNAWKF